MTISRKKVHESYHKKTSPQYKVINNNNFTYRHLLSSINQFIKPGMKILDIGCGAGTLDFYYANKGYEVIGIDISSSAIEACRETAKKLNLSNIRFLKMDFPNTNLRDKFDFIIFTEVIEHIEDDKAALKQIHKLLKKRGLLFLSTPLSNAPLTKLGLTKVFDKEVGHLRRYEQEKLLKMLDESGFEIIKIKINEGILRNFLFVNPRAGTSIRFIKFFLSDLLTIIDDFFLKLFGGSNILITASKVDK